MYIERTIHIVLYARVPYRGEAGAELRDIRILETLDAFKAGRKLRDGRILHQMVAGLETLDAFNVSADVLAQLGELRLQRGHLRLHILPEQGHFVTRTATRLRFAKSNFRPSWLCWRRPTR